MATDSEPKEVKKVPKRLKIIQRVVSKTGMPVGGSVPVEELEGYVSEFLNAGWKLFAFHYLAEIPEGLSMMFVLYKDG
jgi:hypothetical protein